MYKYESDVIVYPACAGMNRTENTNFKARASIPHMRGGDPMQEAYKGEKDA